MKKSMLYFSVFLFVLGTPPCLIFSQEDQIPVQSIDIANLPNDALPLEMIQVPDGDFLFGSTEEEIGYWEDEEEQRSESITRSFYISRCEITVAQWEAVMETNPATFSDSSNLPMQAVSWYDCIRFCNQLSLLAGYDTVYDEESGQGDMGVIGFRLPTEIEWEYACRTGSETRFFWGDDESYEEIGQYAWHAGNSGSMPQIVGTKEANSFGLQDICGNVWEFCHDLKENARLVRGGSWYHLGVYCRSANRLFVSPKYRSGAIGFRVVIPRLDSPNMNDNLAKTNRSRNRIVQRSTKRALRPKTATLREYADTHGFQIGTSVTVNSLRNDERVGESLAREFNIVTPANPMKFRTIHPEPDRYEYVLADTVVDFAEENDLAVRGHTLVFNRYLPEWLENGVWTEEELSDVLRDHIHTVVGNYKGRVKYWDVLNEGTDRDGGYKDTFWYLNLGTEHIPNAFRWAHEADPDAILYLNDAGAEGLGAKSDWIYEYVQELKESDVPVHGVGFQMHITLEDAPVPEDVALNMARLNALGLETQITEIDIRLELPADDRKLEDQARIYADYLRVCLEAENCTAFVMWGHSDLYSWVPYMFDGYGSALIFDEEFQPKPAYDSLLDEFLSFQSGIIPWVSYP